MRRADLIELRVSSRDELSEFAKMETAPDTADYILPYDQARHRAEFERDDIVYLSIYRQSRLAGFFILALDPDPGSVEFRRIVVAARGQGIGQAAIPLMEDYCRDQLGRGRVWLDVFACNRRGRHVYEKLGYRCFDRGELDGKPLLFFDKSIAPARPATVQAIRNPGPR